MTTKHLLLGANGFSDERYVGRSPEEFFSKHAEAYTKSESHAHGSDLALLVELLDPTPSDVALDVATGTGFTAVELARRVKDVLAIDRTDEMLEQASKFAREQHIENIRFERGDATELPCEDSSFNIVTTRRAAHHFSDIPAFLKEARRVLLLGGMLGVVDMSPVEGTQDFFNKIERLRDPTHARALTQKEWVQSAKDAGFLVMVSQVVPETVTLEKWLYPVKLGGPEEQAVITEWDRASEQIRKALDCVVEEGRVVSWTKSRIILIATK